MLEGVSKMKYAKGTNEMKKEKKKKKKKICEISGGDCA